MGMGEERVVNGTEGEVGSLYYSLEMTILPQLNLHVVLTLLLSGSPESWKSKLMEAAQAPVSGRGRHLSTADVLQVPSAPNAQVRQLL